MRIRAAILAILLLVPESPGPLAGEYRRIVSLSPSVTETLFALGLGPEVAGVTRFCEYPPEAAAKPRVGGLFDPNIEAIVSLEPDLVIMLPAHEQVRALLEELGIECLSIPNEQVPDIIETVRIIGERCGADGAAKALADSLDAAAAPQPAAGGTPPGVLVVVDRQYGSAPEEVYAAGKGTWYNGLIEAAGGRNVLDAETPAYPMLSAESLIHLQPDIIIEVVPDPGSRGLTAEGIVSDWDSFGLLEAVREGRVRVLTGRHTAIPGPRFVMVLDDLRAIIRTCTPRKR